MRTATALLFLLLITCSTFAMITFSRRNSTHASGDAKSGRPSANTAARSAGTAKSPADAAPRAEADMLAGLQSGIVVIETAGPGQPTSLGTAFVIDDSGLVATNFHVVSQATEATARFADGASSQIAGYVAVAAENDLAILRLLAPPPDLKALPLRADSDPSPLQHVVAIGHPYGHKFSPYDGSVSRLIRSSQLPAASRRFLARLLPIDQDHRWIQHTARISPGNSGGPLVNRRGEVIGVNTWVDQQTGFGYALHVAYLAQLCRQLAPQVISLEKLARKEARIAVLLRELTPQRIGELEQRAIDMNWRPQDAAQYEILEQLAWAVNVAYLPNSLAGAGGLDDDRLDELVHAADQVVARLSKASWTAPGQITLVNEWAAAQISLPMAGLFFFGTVQRIVEGDDGARGMLVQLAGSDQILFLPLDGQLVDLPAGAQCLVMGVNYDGQTVRYGENPLLPTTAHVVASRVILPLHE